MHKSRQQLCAGGGTNTATSEGPAGQEPLFLGLDFGTSGARVFVINGGGRIVADAKRSYGHAAAEDWAGSWAQALWGLLADLDKAALRSVAAVAIDGTSSTTLLVDRASGTSLVAPKLYNEAQSPAVVEAVKGLAPADHTASASTSTLAKLVAWQHDGLLRKASEDGIRVGLLHQADWLAGLLHGQWDTTDYNNALKLGYDPAAEQYPAWLAVDDEAWRSAFPKLVVAPGAVVGTITAAAAEQTGLPTSCAVCAGTTDSIAAFLAAGVTEAGNAVTSLGSTLAVKLLSNERVDDAAYGVYSHRLGDQWLVGGASNVGGAVLRRYFSDQQLQELTECIDPAIPSGLDYYPLPVAGERFPINDPAMPPRLEPRPADDAQFLQGILEGIAEVEGAAYARLAQMGASRLTKVYTAGGGAANDKWTAIRTAKLGVPVMPSPNVEAAYGSALLARQGWQALQPDC